MPTLHLVSVRQLFLSCLLVGLVGVVEGWVSIGSIPRRCAPRSKAPRAVRCQPLLLVAMAAAVDENSLLEMDVVVYSERNGDENGPKVLGAVQADGTVAPLSAWTMEPAFGDSLEFVVDEADLLEASRSRGGGRVTVHAIAPEESISYGSRQLYGGKGPGNPHGEESEVVYYVERSFLSGVEWKLKPELEILW